MSDDTHDPGDPESLPPPAGPLGREKPVRPSGWQPGQDPWAPITEASRDPRAAFESELPPPPAAWLSKAPADGGSMPALAPGGSPPPPPHRPPVAAIPPPPPPRERYPMVFDIAYPEQLSRWKTLLRGFFIVPAFVFFYLASTLLNAALVVGWTGVFWRKKYPAWAFAGAAGALDYYARFASYWLLLSDTFPGMDREASPVRLDFDAPPRGSISRWRVILWKSALLIPHLFFLGALATGLWVVTVIAWFGILFTGNYPRGLFGFSVGVLRWQFRITAYFASFNDRFPPYSLSAEAGPASKTSTVWSGAVGLLIGGSMTAGIIALAVAGSRTHTEDVNYAELQSGASPVVFGFDKVGGAVLLTLNGVTDPGDNLVKILTLEKGERIVVFEWNIVNFSGASQGVDAHPALYTVSVAGKDGRHERDLDAVFVSVNNRAAPATVRSVASATVQAVFVVPADATPVQLQFNGGFAGVGGVTYRFK